MFLLLCPSMPDHHLTTTVQPHRKMSEKPVVTTNNGLFLVFGGHCAEPTIFAFQRLFASRGAFLGRGLANPFGHT